MAAISYTLELDGRPADAELLGALQQLEVEDHADMADMLRLRLAVSVDGGGGKWKVLDDAEAFKRLSNIKLSVKVGKSPAEPLIDAYVIESSASFSNQPGQSVLHVVAMDPSVLMNLEEKAKAWPNMSDSDIASQIFDEYGFEADVEETKPARQDSEVTTIQRGTDIQFLKQLAARNGYECFVESGSGGKPVGHFHAPKLEEQPQGTLSVAMGEATNLNSFEAKFDMLKSVEARVTGLDHDAEDPDDHKAEAQSPARKDLGGESASSKAAERPRKILLSSSMLPGSGEEQAYAQTVVDDSTWAITAEGEVNTAAYGGVVRAKRPVLVRGAGRVFSGSYYVTRVLHTFVGDSYTQSLSMRRNALGLTGRERFAADGALA